MSSQQYVILILTVAIQNTDGICLKNQSLLLRSSLGLGFILQNVLDGELFLQIMLFNQPKILARYIPGGRYWCDYILSGNQMMN